MKIKSIIVANNPILGNLKLDFTDHAGNPVDTIILAGENGCGKSTILNLIFELSQCTILDKVNSNEMRTYEVVLSPSDMEYFSTYLPPGIVELFRDQRATNNITITYDLRIRNNSSQAKVSFYLADGTISTNKLNILGQVKACFRSLFSDTEINFTPSMISSVTSKNIDQVIPSSVKTGAHLATEITQLLVDIQALDDADFTTSVRTSSSDKIDRRLLDVRINRFKQAYSYMFPSKKYKSIQTINGEKKVIFEENNQDIYIENLSSGEKQIVFRGGFLLKDQGTAMGSIIMIDEPEISLHPLWQLKILNFYKQLCTNQEGTQTSQLFIATHSPFILHNDNRSNDKCLVLSRNSNGNVLVDEDGKYFGWESQKTIEKAFGLQLTISPQKTTIITEGKTDWKHLKKALAQLQRNQKFLDLDVQFHEYTEEMGDAKLKNMCEFYARRYQPHKILFMFDRDVPSVMKDVVEEPFDYRNWGNNVFSFAIPIPDHRIETPDICIEFYYTDEEIMTTDSKGRRLYISTEFHNTSGRHITLPLLNCTDSKFRSDRLSIIDNCVFNHENHNIALSKNKFADNIINEVEGFQSFNFDNYIKIFELISKIARL